MGALLHLDRLCFGDRSWSIHAWWEVVHEQDWLTLVGEGPGGEMMAAAVLLPVPPVASLASLAVRPSWRRMGVGRALVEEMIERSRDASVRWVELEVDAGLRNAIRLYRHAGFGIVRRFREGDLLRLGMVRRLRREGETQRRRRHRRGSPCPA